ncbi:hypothetical protein BVY03_04370 [bacterium K02(2017)]|nr:hypothetical protein BVY03_04370 [bacterium K02(2017)]
MRKADPKKINTSIYDYWDFKLFLKDLAAEFKEKRTGFNLRDFAKKAGLKTPGLLKMVYDGKRRLTLETREAFALAFELSGRQKIYFDTLVSYNQEDAPDKKRELFDTLNDLRPRSKKYTHQKKLIKYLTEDYYVTIREMILLDDFIEEYDWMAKRCAPRITATEAKEAVETLLEIGLLKRNAKGKLEHAENLVQSEDYHTQIIEAYHFHDAVLKKARASLNYFEQHHRSFQSLTLTLPKGMSDEIITKYNEFRDWVINRSNEIGTCDEVYHVNFQLFPATLNPMLQDEDLNENSKSDKEKDK